MQDKKYALKASNELSNNHFADSHMAVLRYQIIKHYESRDVFDIESFKKQLKDEYLLKFESHVLNDLDYIKKLKKDNNLNMFVSDRVCTEVNKCNIPLQVEIPLDKSLITRNLNLDSMKFGSTSTTNICTFNNQYFIKKNKDLDYCNCSRIVLKYTISGSPTTDILKHSPKFILRKRNKEALMIMKLNV